MPHSQNPLWLYRIQKAPAPTDVPVKAPDKVTPYWPEIVRCAEALNHTPCSKNKHATKTIHLLLRLTTSIYASIIATVNTATHLLLHLTTSIYAAIIATITPPIQNIHHTCSPISLTSLIAAVPLSSSASSSPQTGVHILIFLSLIIYFCPVFRTQRNTKPLRPPNFRKPFHNFFTPILTSIYPIPDTTIILIINLLHTPHPTIFLFHHCTTAPTNFPAASASCLATRKSVFAHSPKRDSAVSRRR